MKPKERILNFLKDNGKQPTSRISQDTTINYYKVKKLLFELLKEKKVKKIEKNSFTYWEVNNKEKT